MSNEHKMAGVSTLPLIIILGLIFGAGYFLLRGDIDLSKFLEDNRSLEMRRLEDFPAVVPVTTEHEKYRVVIKSDQELIDFLAKVDETNNLALAEKIDYDREMLIGVATENFGVTGHSMKIRKIYMDRDSNSLLVSSMITQPDDSCEVTDYENVAVDLVAVDKTDMPVDFETLRQTDFCE